MGIKECEDQEIVLQIRKELSRASRNDRIRRKEQLAKGLTAEDVLVGTGLHADTDYKTVSIKHIRTIQDWFKGRCIRRTHRSKDNHGKPIFELKDYLEHKIILTLMDKERQTLEQEAEEAVKTAEDSSKNWTEVSDEIFAACLPGTRVGMRFVRYQRTRALPAWLFMHESCPLLADKPARHVSLSPSVRLAAARVRYLRTGPPWLFSPTFNVLISDI